MAPSRPVLAVLALLLTLPASAQDASDVLRQAREGAAGQAAGNVQGAAVAAPVNRCMQGLQDTRTPGKFCESVRDCRAYCSCACTFDFTKWRPVRFDGSTTCDETLMPRSGVNMLTRQETQALPRYRHLVQDGQPGERGERATQTVLDGLQRLDDWLENSAERRRLGFRIRVANCWRPAYDDSVDECGYVLKAQHMLNKPNLDDRARETWELKSNPQNLGLAWPGSSPHSGGAACDLILQDSAGQDCHDVRAGVVDRENPVPTCAIDQRQASRLLDEAVTNTTVGGRRLEYEAWHYEWGTTTGSRCVHPGCADNHYPVAGRP